VRACTCLIRGGDTILVPLPPTEVTILSLMPHGWGSGQWEKIGEHGVQELVGTGLCFELV
jgi:hypothetical protein